jgi:hypothetical protein
MNIVWLSLIAVAVAASRMPIGYGTLPLEQSIVGGASYSGSASIQMSGPSAFI